MEVKPDEPLQTPVVKEKAKARIPESVMEQVREIANLHKPTLSERLAALKTDMVGDVINVRDITGTSCFGWEPHGEQLRQQMTAAINQKGKVTLNFKGIRGFAYIAIEVAFSELVETYGDDVFGKQIFFQGESPESERALRNKFLGAVDAMDANKPIKIRRR